MDDDEPGLRVLQALFVMVIIVLGMILPTETFWLVCGWIMIGSLIIAVIVFFFAFFFGS
ncbi:MAG: hypothetical protein M5U26_12585 [Planctomycetota bacterium]|nr:hypothetical protein [Planctomycetota bacterium]